jgi:hypothetical protein
MAMDEQHDTTYVDARVLSEALTVPLQRQHLASLLAAAEELSFVRTRHAARTPGFENETRPSQDQRLRLIQVTKYFPNSHRECVELSFVALVAEEGLPAVEVAPVEVRHREMKSVQAVEVLQPTRY